MDFIINAFATLFVTLDPVGLAPMFLAVTAGLPVATRRKVAIQGTITAALVLLLFYVTGQTLLNILGISVPAFRVSGGILLFIISIEMVFGKRQERKTESAEKAVESIDAHHGSINEMAIFPIGIPLLAGPAAISAVILLSGQSPNILTYTGLGIIIILILSMCLLTCLAAEIVERFIGDSAQLIITRLLGLLLAAMSVQFVIDGLLKLIPSLTH